MSPATLPPAAAIAEITSELVEYRNAAGLLVRAYFDHARSGSPSRKFAVMAPKYGETKKNNLQLAYELVANGMSVLRFDLTNHIGESEGAMTDFTLPGEVNDIIASIEYLERKYAAADILLIASSLSGRCALRAAALTPRLSRVICIAGVVNVQHTLFETYKEDYFGSYAAGRRRGVMDMLGFNVHAEQFMQTAIDSDLHALGGTIRDLDRMQMSVDYFFAENDPWVKLQEVQAALSGRSNCRLFPVPGAMHELHENPKAANRVYEAVVRCCLDLSEQECITSIPRKIVLEQNRIERNRLRQLVPGVSDETTFWSNYFAKYKLLERSHAYQAYLDLFGRLLGPFDEGRSVLDAGCGNGLFGLWFIRHVARHQGWDEGRLPCVYVGVDLTVRGLRDALADHAGCRAALEPWRIAPPGFLYAQADFELLGDQRAPLTSRLPFADATFDSICCSLVVSYLNRPEILMGEVYRILRPGGVLVISSLKPHCDLSEIYRGFLDQQVDQADIESGRGLLSAATTIRLKAEAGHYTFFTEQELVDLAEAAGFTQFETHRSFGNQANVLRAAK